MAARRKNKIPFGEKMGYGVGALSYGIPFQLLSGCFIFYATEILQISGTLAGTILALSIIWDAFTDPVMGYMSDHTNRNILFGRRLFYVMIGAAGIAISNFFLWRIDPALSNMNKVVLLTALILLVKTFSTILTTPYLALGAELSSDYIERTSVQSFRTAFFFLGFLFPTIIGMGIFFRPVPGFENGQLNPAAYSSLGLTASIIVLTCAAICIMLTHRKEDTIVQTPVKKRNPLINLFKETAEALKCSDFRNISFSLLFINMAMGIVGAVGMHVFTFTFAFSSGQIAVVFGALFLMALIGQPLWVTVVKKYEKREILKACLYINIVISLCFFICVLFSEWVSKNYLSVLPLSLLIGLSMGGSIALPYAMISDTIDKDAYYSGIRKEGVFYGCATFMYKVSQALSALFVGSLIDIIGFDSELVQTRNIYVKLGMILPVGFLVCFIFALFFASRYTLDRRKVEMYQGNKSTDN